MINQDINQLSHLQKEVLSNGSSSGDILKLFLRDPRGKILTIQNDKLLLVPVYHPQIPKCAWSEKSLFLEIRTVFASSEIAIQVFNGKASDYVFDHVVNWLLLCPSQERLLAGGRT